MKKIFTLVFLVFFLASCSGKIKSDKANTGNDNKIGFEQILPKDEEGYVEFSDAIKSGKIVIAKFGLDICIGCIEANKILISLMPVYGKAIYFSKVDLIKDKGAEKKYNIKMMPTIVFFDKSGKEFFRLEGEISKQAIIDKLESFCWSY